jgi:hypothetical protein
MMSLEIEPQYLAHDEDASENAEQNESSVIDGEEYGEEGMAESAEFSKIKRDKVFMQIDFTKRKTKIVCTLG